MIKMTEKRQKMNEKKSKIFIETDQMRHNEKMRLNKVVKEMVNEDPKMKRELRYAKKSQRKKFYRDMRKELLNPETQKELKENEEKIKAIDKGRENNEKDS